MGILLVTFIGLVLGSFATALAYRIPRDISIVTKTRSECTSCGRALTFIDLIPLFSWLFLKGRCRTCKAKIGIRYPLIELGTLVICMIFYYAYDLSFEYWPFFMLVPILVSIISIDFEFQIIPDELNFAIFMLGIMLFLSNSLMYASPIDFMLENGMELLGGFLIYGVGFASFRLIAMLIMKREPMGMGDIKFFAAAGVWLGTSLERLSLLMLVAGLSGIILGIIWKKMTGEKEFPFGPSIILGFIAALCIYPISYV